MKRLALLLSVLLVALCAGAEAQYSDLTFKILKQETGKPVRNASVILHSVDSKGKQDKGGVSLKTDAEGKAAYNNVPYGTIRVQVIAHGLQTFGEDIQIKEPQQEITIKLKPPQEQYTIYGDEKKAPEKKQ